MIFTPIKPMLLEMGRDAFDSPDHIFEPKWDGWRVLIHKDGDHVEAYTRHGNRITDKFPELLEVGAAIRAHTAIVDCEGVCMRDGRPVFDDFAERGILSNERKIDVAARRNPATFVAFDLLLDGDTDRTGEPLIDRKARLQELIDPRPEITATMYVEGQGKALYALTKERDLEGIVAKRKDSRYQIDTRSDAWLKIKHWKIAECVIMGYRTQPQFGMIVGLHDRHGELRPVATVEFGFSSEQKMAFKGIARQLHTEEKGGVQWIEPALSCRVQYLERTERGALRICSFKGFLFEKDLKNAVSRGYSDCLSSHTM